MIYVLAGHTPKGANQDPGAVANGVREADLTMQLRDLVADQIRKMNYPIYEDDDTDRLAQVLAKINSTEKDVIFDIHFNAAGETATGVEVVIPTRHTEGEKKFASIIANSLSGMMILRNRGVITEDKTARKKLAIMQENGLNLLVEVCFITNKTDLAKYQKNIKEIALELALILCEAQNSLV